MKSPIKFDVVLTQVTPIVIQGSARESDGGKHGVTPGGSPSSPRDHQDACARETKNQHAFRGHICHFQGSQHFVKRKKRLKCVLRKNKGHQIRDAGRKYKTKIVGGQDNES